MNLAADVARDRGIIVAVGTVGMNIQRGPGRYDAAYERKGRDYPIGYARWTENRNMEAFLQLLADGKIDVRTLITQHSGQLMLDDGHSQSMVASLTSSASSDLIGQLSNTRLAGGGYYSPYVGAIVDLARIMGNLRTATYQYIPALALPKHDHLNLKLNNPPSFRKPKSVLVVALPAVERAHLPLLRAVDANQVFCLAKPSLVLPVEGAPLVFSTALAHDFAIGVQTENGSSIELPAIADAARGGFVIDTHALENSQLASRISGKLHGFWGYQSFAGPNFDLRSAHATKWSVVAGIRMHSSLAARIRCIYSPTALPVSRTSS